MYEYRAYFRPVRFQCAKRVNHKRNFFGTSQVPKTELGENWGISGRAGVFHAGSGDNLKSSP